MMRMMQTRKDAERWLCDGFGASAANRQAAVAHVTAALTDEGWVVQSSPSRPSDAADLTLHQGDQERHVEVKGTGRSNPAFHLITAQELPLRMKTTRVELWRSSCQCWLMSQKPPLLRGESENALPATCSPISRGAQKK